MYKGHGLSRPIRYAIAIASAFAVSLLAAYAFSGHPLP